MEIKNIEELLGPYLKEHGKTFVSYDCKHLLPTGENYGSTMLAVNLRVKNSDDTEEIQRYVAKTLPPSKTVREFFNVPVTFKKEVNHYKTVVPILEALAKERGVEDLTRCFAKCVGARICLNPESDVVDDDAVIILENLKVHGYIIRDRLTGFDLRTTELILKDIARMHAAIIDLKLAKPEEFQTKVLPNLDAGITFVPSDDMLEKMVRSIQKHASLNQECVPLLDRIATGTRTIQNFYPYSKFKEPFATIVHADLWPNNILVKYVDDRPASNVFVDFQVCRYGSPARDVIFFLYSSVELDVLRTKVDELLKLYHNELIDVLRKLKCDAPVFTFESFMEEANEVGRDIEFGHLMFMLTPLFTIRGRAKEITEWRPEDLAPDDDEMLHENYYPRLHFTILDFARRDWI